VEEGLFFPEFNISDSMFYGFVAARVGDSTDAASSGRIGEREFPGLQKGG
jgi:hypothetical protein